jgi:NAD(P)-dependent dehydrogenase (short-subunit alcohol dehydrogenase family)
MLRHVVAIVSGGSSGLGAATTSFIIRHGGKVVVADLPSSKDSYLRLATVACAEAATSSTYRHHNYYYQNIHYNNHRRNQPSSPSHHDDGKKSKNETRMIDRIIAFSETDVRKEEDVKRALNLAEDQFGKSGK